MKEKARPAATTESQLRRLAAEVFVFGYPLVLMDAVRTAHAAPDNQFVPLPDRGETLSPGLNQEDPRMLRSGAWLDLSRGPVVVSLPDMRGRYSLLSLFDAWGELFAMAGSRSYTDAGYDLAIVGPHWHGELAAGLTARRARTDRVWALSRIAAHVPADRDATRELMTRHYVLPLLEGTGTVRPCPTPVTPPKAGVAEAVANLSPATFLARLEQLVRRHPLRAIDHEMIEAFERMEIGEPPNGATSRELFDQAVGKGFADGRSMLRNAVWPSTPDSAPTWRTAPRARPSDDPLIRAAAAYHALGAAPHADVLHLICDADSRGARLDGSRSYRLHFPRGAAPPAKAFWSLSLASPPKVGELELRRRALTDRDGPVFNRDGSLDIFIQHDPPTPGRAANWLPVPSGEFSLSMRLYWPRPEATNGSWSMPAIEVLEPAAARWRGAHPDLLDLSDDRPGAPHRAGSAADH